APLCLLRCNRLTLYGFCGALVDVAAGGGDDGDSAGVGAAAGVVDRFRARGRAGAGAGDSGAAAGIAAYGAGFLSAGRAGAAECAGTPVDTNARASAGVQLCGIAGGIGDL